MDNNKSVTDIINEVVNDICYNYCKHPEQHADYDDFDEWDAMDRLYTDHCNACPINRLGATR